MTLWTFLSRESDISLPRVFGIAAVSGLANALLLAIVNRAASAADDGGPSGNSFTLFIIAITLYVLTQRHILRVSTVEIEKIIAKVRIKIAAKIRAAELPVVEQMGRSQIFSSINTHTMTLSGATAPMVLACQGALLVLFSAVYIFIESKVAFFMTVAILAAGIAFHLRTKEQVIREMNRATMKENELFTAYTHLLEGFKEVKLSARRSADLFSDLSNIATDVAALKTRSGIRYSDMHIFTQVLFYLLLGAIVFILPDVSRWVETEQIVSLTSDQVTKISAAILFIIGPLSLIVGVFPMFARANHAIQNIVAIEDQLESRLTEPPTERPTPPSFQRIELVNVTYSYIDRDGRPSFTVGPVNLAIADGETLFIVGGNGSGKSTLLKVLTGLYRPTSGAIYVDGVPVETIGYAAYRELFSAVFSDYHLFDRLYGIADVDDEEVYRLLAEMELKGKTDWREGRFVNQDLSTGQRKRLALLISRLDRKPVQVFDEWAADQDPHFRSRFYRELLGVMKAAGTRTIIAATHDDRYFGVADRIIKMEEGKVIAVERKGSASQ